MNVELELEMKISCRDLRLLLLREFHLGRKATSNICGTTSKNILSVRTAQHCFHRFKNGNFELDDLLPTGRPLQAYMDLLKQLIDKDSKLATWGLSERPGCSHTAVETNLHELDKMWKYGIITAPAAAQG